MKKITSALLAAALMLTVLTSCGGKKSSGDDTTVQNGSETDGTQTTEKTVEPTDDTDEEQSTAASGETVEETAEKETAAEDTSSKETTAKETAAKETAAKETTAKETVGPEPAEKLKVYVDMDFDDANDGADVPGVTQEGAGFKIYKDGDGNGWAVAGSSSEWASMLFDAYDEKGNVIYPKDFCFETRAFLAIGNKGEINDGGMSMCVTESDRYDVCLYWGKSNSGVNVYQASDTAKGTVADNIEEDKGHVTFFRLFDGQEYVFTVIGKYRQDNDGNEWIKLIMFIDGQRVLEHEIPYWDGGFALRGLGSEICYDYVTVTEIPSVFPDGNVK